jgi:hypothetical protein
MAERVSVVTVSELIAALQEMPQEVDVYLRFDGFGPSSHFRVEQTTFGEGFGDYIEPETPSEKPIVIID